jgi:hypothetical protein
MCGGKISALWKFWIRQQPQSCGWLLETALKCRFGQFIDWDKLEKQFYGREK